MDERSAILRALALVDQAITAESDQQVADAIQPDLAVLSREDLTSRACSPPRLDERGRR